MAVIISCACSSAFYLHHTKSAHEITWMLHLISELQPERTKLFLALVNRKKKLMRKFQRRFPFFISYVSQGKVSLVYAYAWGLFAKKAPVGFWMTWLVYFLFYFISKIFSILHRWAAYDCRLFKKKMQVRPDKQMPKTGIFLFWTDMKRLLL